MPFTAAWRARTSPVAAVLWPSSDPVAISPALAQALPVAEAAAATFPGVPPAAIPAVKADWAAAHASELPPAARQPFSAASFHFSEVSKMFSLYGSDHLGQRVARALENEFRLIHFVEGLVA